MSAKFVLDGSAGGAVKAVEQLNAALDKTAKKSDDAAKGSKRLQDAAQRIKESVEPQTKYNRLVGELKQHVDSGRISIEQATAKTAQYDAALHRAGGAGNAAFGPAMVGKIASMAGGIFSATAAVGALKEAFQQAEAAAQSAADAIFDSLGAVGELGQLGPEGLPRALRIQRSLIETGTVKPTNRAQAADIAANLINANLTDDQVNLITKDLGGAGGLVKAENLNSVGGNLKSLMTQFGEKDMRQVAAQVLVAANKTKADLAVTSNNVLKFGELAGGAGISLEEAMAGYVASEKSAASPEAAAEAQKSFYSQVYRRRLSTGDLEGTLDKIKASIPKGGTAFDVLGDANAVVGFESLMKDRAGLRRDLGEISAPPAGMIRDSGGLLGKVSPANRAAQLKARAEGTLSVAQEDLSAERESLFDAYRAELNTRGTKRNEWSTTKYLRNWQMDADDENNNEIGAFRGELRQTQLTGQRISDDLLAAMKDLLERIEENTSKTKDATEGTNKKQGSKITTRSE